MKNNIKDIVIAFIFLAIVQLIFLTSGFLSISFNIDFGIAKHFFNKVEMLVACGMSLFVFAIYHLQDVKKWRIISFGFVVVMLVFISSFSFASSLLNNKFIFVTNITKLKENYDLLSDGYIFGFLKNTLPLHQGDSESAGVSFFYMIPMFISTVFFGGLSLFNLAVVNAVGALFALQVYYFFVKKYYGNNVAVVAAVLFGSSYYFQNFLRSSSYLGISLLICGLFLYTFYMAFIDNKKIVLAAFVLMLGFHFYGPLRYFFLMPLLFLPNRHKRKKVLSFYFWFFVFVLPFVLLRLKVGGGIFDEEHVLVYSKGYEYGENFLTYLDKMSAVFNLPLFIKGVFLQIYKNFNLLFSIFNTETLQVNPYHSNLLSFLILPFFIFGFFTSLKKCSKEIYAILLFLFICIVIAPFIITADPVQVRRIMLWPPVVFLFIGVGFNDLINLSKNTKIKNIILILCFTIFSFHIIKEVRNIFYFIPKRAAQLEFFYDKKVMKNDIKEKDEIYKLIDRYFATGVNKAQIDDIVFKKTTEGESNLKETVSVVERFLPDVVLPDDNDVFFKRDFFALWGSVGDAFVHQPIKKEGLPADVIIGETNDSLIIHTFYKQNNSETQLVGDDPIGTFTSPLFIVDKRYFSFLLGGGPTVNERVELLVGGEVVMWNNSDYDKGVKKVVWDLKPYKGREARICLVDYSGRPGGFLVVADMKFSNQNDK